MILFENGLFLFSNPEIVIRELARVLKRDCPLIVTASNKYVAALTYVPDNLNRAYDLLLEKYHMNLELKGVTGPKVYHITPNSFRELLEKRGLKVEKIIGKVITLPLRFQHEIFFSKEYTQDLLDRILRIELFLCEKPDSIGLAGHLQAIAYKL